MADIDVPSFIKQLRQHLPHVPPIPARKLQSFHNAQDYEGMVRFIRSAMNLDVRLNVGWVNSGGPTEAPAWVEIPANVPYYGTPEFKKLLITVCIRKEFIRRTGYEQLAIAIAHELSHVVLDSIHHPLRKEEKAVDLTAMLLGFSHLYLTAAHTSNSQIGYLTATELKIATRMLVPTRLRIARKASLLIQQFALQIILIGVVASIWISAKVNSKTALHQSLQSEADNLVIPRVLNPYMTLVDARVGPFSLTKTYLVAQPARLDLVSREQRVRDSICSKKRANIDAGAVYAFEYREQSGSIIGSFEISSCP
jgi:hypothetical protein